jgi:DNA-binding response OmpR family regulator
MLMEMMGNRVRTAHDGIEALLAGREFQPDIVLLDIGLPRLSGYDVARKVRQETWGSRVTLIAVTGWGEAEDIDRSREAGFDHHLVKPVEPATLAALLRQPTGATL